MRLVEKWLSANALTLSCHLFSQGGSTNLTEDIFDVPLLHRILNIHLLLCVFGPTWLCLSRMPVLQGGTHPTGLTCPKPICNDCATKVNFQGAGRVLQGSFGTHKLGLNPHPYPHMAQTSECSYGQPSVCKKLKSLPKPRTLVVTFVALKETKISHFCLTVHKLLVLEFLHSHQMVKNDDKFSFKNLMENQG